MDAIDTKINSMASKTDVENMKEHILVKTKEYIDESVQPVKNEMKALQKEVEHIKKNPGNGGSGNAKDETIVHLQKQLDKLDPAKKRVIFMGWPDNVSAENRLEIISKYMKDHFSNFRVVDTGCFYMGPYPNRKL